MECREANGCPRDCPYTSTSSPPPTPAPPDMPSWPSKQAPGGRYTLKCSDTYPNAVWTCRNDHSCIGASCEGDEDCTPNPPDAHMYPGSQSQLWDLWWKNCPYEAHRWDIDYKTRGEILWGDDCPSWPTVWDEETGAWSTKNYPKFTGSGEELWALWSRDCPAEWTQHGGPGAAQGLPWIITKRGGSAKGDEASCPDKPDCGTGQSGGVYGPSADASTKCKWTPGRFFGDRKGYTDDDNKCGDLTKGACETLWKKYCPKQCEEMYGENSRECGNYPQFTDLDDI